MRLRDDPAFLDRTGARALSTVPVRRTSGSPAAPAPRSEDRAGTARGHLSSTMQPVRNGKTIRSLARRNERELPAFAAHNQPATVGRQPRRHGRNAR